MASVTTPNSSVMIEKFAGVCDMVVSEFLNLNHTSNTMILVSLVISKFAPKLASNTGELQTGTLGPIRKSLGRS
jgi:hypothetical protein